MGEDADVVGSSTEKISIPERNGYRNGVRTGSKNEKEKDRMKLNELYEKPLKQVIGEMNLADVKIYSDGEKNVQEVLLKYTVPAPGDDGCKIPMPLPHGF